MIDAEFISKLKELETQGQNGVYVMRQILIENGGMKRLIALAERGLGAKARATTGGFVDTTVKTHIPDEFPGETEKQAAILYWEQHRRPDLVAMVGHEAEMFYNHHYSKGTKSRSWRASWQTWYSNAMKFTKPPRGTDLFPLAAVVAFEQTNLAGWTRRLHLFYDTNVWSTKWGGKPPARLRDPIPSDCKCPVEAFSIYLKNRDGDENAGRVEGSGR